LENDIDAAFLARHVGLFRHRRGRAAAGGAQGGDRHGLIGGVAKRKGVFAAIFGRRRAGRCEGAANDNGKATAPATCSRQKMITITIRMTCSTAGVIDRRSYDER